MEQTGTALKGLPVIDLKEGQRLGELKDLLIDLKGLKLYGLQVLKNRFIASSLIIPFTQLREVGDDAVMVDYSPPEKDELQLEVKKLSFFQRRKMITVEGNFFGELVDILFDLNGGEIRGYVCGNFDNSDIKSRLALLPGHLVHLLGSDLIIVSAESQDHLSPWEGEARPGETRNLLSLTAMVSERLQDLQRKIFSQQRKGQQFEMASELRLEEEKYLVGKILRDDLKNESGETILQAGERITEEKLNSIRSQGLISLLWGRLE